MTSVGHGDAETIADTVIGHESTEWDPYEESLAETATIVDAASLKEDADSKSWGVVKKEHEYDVAGPPRPTLFKVIRGIGSLPFRAVNSVTSLAQRMLALCNAEMQIRGAMLANAAVIQRRYSKNAKFSGSVSFQHKITSYPDPTLPVVRKVCSLMSHRSRGSFASESVISAATLRTPN